MQYVISFRLYIVNNISLFLGVLENGADDFEDSDEIYEAIGEVLHEISEKTEDDIRY